jgi:putative ABC transport system ATP-binding protein
MDSKGSAAVVVRGLTRVLGSGDTRVEALRGVDLTLEPGEFVAVTGPSGSGKSTLLHLIAGLDRPTGGSVRVGGYDLGSWDDEGRTLLRRRWIGMIFQAFHLLDTMTALENVALPLTIAGWGRRPARVRAAQTLERVGLGPRLHHRPQQLSGGEQQRVAIARALVIDPLILLADEPTGNLDSATGAQVMALLRGLAGQRRHTILLVTHDPAQAAAADRVVVLHDGRVVNEPPPPRGRREDGPRSRADAVDLHVA